MKKCYKYNILQSTCVLTVLKIIHELIAGVQQQKEIAQNIALWEHVLTCLIIFHFSLHILYLFRLYSLLFAILIYRTKQ